MASPLPRPPWRQGQLDGLCGLYAAINALAYVLTPVITVDRRWAGRLFKHGLAHITEHVPLNTAVRDGIDPEPWVALVTHLSEHVAAKLDVPISVTLPFAGNAKVGRDEWLDLARTTLDAGDALLLLLAGEHLVAVCQRANAADVHARHRVARIEGRDARARDRALLKADQRLDVGVLQILG